VLFLQELKIRQGDAKTLAVLLAALNTPLHAGDVLTDDRTYTLDVVLPRDRYNARGFGGRLYGVGTVLRTDFARERVARVRDVPWDLEGRVSVVELKGETAQDDDNDNHPNQPDTQTKSPNATSSPPTVTPTTTATPPPNKYRTTASQPLALLNVYAVNGTAALYLDPATGRPNHNHSHPQTRHDHKRAFHTRLRDECLALQARGFAVVVAGDLNVARSAWDGYPNLRTWPSEHVVNRADFNARFFGRGDCERAGVALRDLPRYDGDSGGKGGGRDGDAGGERVDGAEGKQDRDWGESGPGGGTGTIGERKEGREACLDAVDVFRALHGAERRYTYYPRTREWGTSCDRVDMVFVSRALWEAGRVLGTGILDTPQERGLSDHVPLWVEIALDEPVEQENCG
jgi:exonuclease III